MHVLAVASAVPRPNAFRVAVCLSGQQRLNSHALTHFAESLPAEVVPDYFCFFWSGMHATEAQLTEAILKKIHGKAARVHTTITEPFEPDLDFRHDVAPKVNPHSIMSMYYAIEQANAMKRAFEDAEGFRYDIVIRQRADVALMAPLDLQRYRPVCRQNIVVLPDRGNYVGFNDQFAFSSSQAMDVYASVYSNIRDLCQRGCLLYAEMLLRCHLRTQAIEVAWAPLNAIILRF